LQRIRVVLVAIEPALLRDSTRQLLSADPEVDVVKDVESPGALVEEVRRTGVDLVLLGLANRNFPEEAHDLLREFPRMKVLGLAAEGRRAFLYETQPHVVPMGELDGDRLVRVVKEAVRAAR
jgi:DNA-binding NarL/FixJ family response regulator